VPDNTFDLVNSPIPDEEVGYGLEKINLDIDTGRGRSNVKKKQQLFF
jgi:hypothetical protein